jgi:malate synthase
VNGGDRFTPELCGRLLREEYAKLLAAGTRDVHENSKTTTLPIARAIVETYLSDQTKLPWYIDLLNITLGTRDLEEANRRIRLLADAFRADGTRITANLDF